MKNQSEVLVLSPHDYIAKTQILNASLGRIIVPRSNNTPLPYTLIYATLAALVIVSNGLIVIIFLKSREVRKRKSHLFLLSLSCADLLVGFCSLGYLFSIKSESLGKYSKRISTIILTFSLETSMFSLCSLTYDRLVAIRNSLQYQRLFTSKTVVAAIISTWFASAVLTGVQGALAFTIEYGQKFELNGIVIVVFALITSIFLAVVYLYLYKEIRRHTRDITNQSASVANSIDIDLSPTIKSADEVPDGKSFRCEQESILKHRTNKQLLRLTKEKKSLLLCSLIVCSFILCWTPITIFFAGVLLRKEHLRQDIMMYVCTILVLVNSLLNPIIYFGLRQDMRRAAIVVLCK